MKIIIIAIILTMALPIIKVEAKEKTATELYKEDKDAFYKKYMCLDEEAKEKGLYSDANKGEYTKTKKKENKENKTTYEAKGWVYSTDELHIVGLPEDSETGYTKAGNYGQIEK